jgi:hypothetical protein
LRFNNNTTALIFGSFHQGKEQRFHFKTPLSTSKNLRTTRK